MILKKTHTSLAADASSSRPLRIDSLVCSRGGIGGLIMFSHLLTLSREQMPMLGAGRAPVLGNFGLPHTKPSVERRQRTEPI